DEELGTLIDFAEGLAAELECLSNLWLLAAVVPVQLDGRLRAAGGIVVVHDAPLGRADGINGRAFRGDGRRCSQVEGPVDEVHEVTAEVAEGTVAVVPEVSPCKRMHALAIGALRSGAEPEIPVEAGGSGSAGSEFSAGVFRCDPDVDFVHFADRAGI